MKLLEQHPGHACIVSGLAKIYAFLWLDHGFDDAKPKAIDSVKKIRTSGLHTLDGYVAQVFVELGTGNAKDTRD
ncbi:hypothetical protein ACFL6C_11565 [Myxococcota bacterium]